MKKLFFILLVLLVGCVTTPIKKDIEDEVGQIYSFPFELVWEKVIALTVKEHLPTIVAEKDSGIIVTDWIKTNGWSAGFEESLFLQTTDERSKISIQVSKNSPEKTEVNLAVHTEKFCEYTDISGTKSYSWRATYSSGYFERRFFTELDKLTGADLLRSIEKMFETK